MHQYMFVVYLAVTSHAPNALPSRSQESENVPRDILPASPQDHTRASQLEPERRVSPETHWKGTRD